MTLSNIQGLAIAAAVQVVGVAVALGALTNAQSQIIVSAASSVISLVVAILTYAENQQRIASAKLDAKQLERS